MATGLPLGIIVPRSEYRKTIRVSESTFWKWRSIKKSSGFAYSSDSEFAEALLHVAVTRKLLRIPETSTSLTSDAATSSSAAAQSGKDSTLGDEESQNQIVINIDIMETDGNQSSITEGSCGTSTGNPMPRVIVTSFNPKADTFDVSVSKPAESQSLASEASLVSSHGGDTDKEAVIADVVDVETCDVANPKGLKRFESSSIHSKSLGSSSGVELVEEETSSNPKRRKEAGVDDSLAQRIKEGFADLFVDPLGEETLFGAVLTNYQQKIRKVMDSIEKIKQEKKEGETALNLKEARMKVLEMELGKMKGVYYKVWVIKTCHDYEGFKSS
ncbi:hypothetical protein ACROYT_G010464 [Oculina patagonica]